MVLPNPPTFDGEMVFDDYLVPNGSHLWQETQDVPKFGKSTMIQAIASLVAHAQSCHEKMDPWLN